MEVSFAQDFDPADDYPNSDSYESSSGIEELGEEEDDFEFAHKQTRSKSKAKSDILPEEFPDPEEFEFKTSKNIAQLKVHGGAGDGKVGKSRSMEFTNIFKKNYRSKRNSLTMKPTTNLLLVKESGKRFRRRWVFLTDTSIRCYRTQVVCIFFQCILFLLFFLFFGIIGNFSNFILFEKNFIYLF